MGCGDLIWSLSILDPLCESGDSIELVRTIAALTVVHSWNHEQSNGVGRLGCVAKRVGDILVILNGIHRWNTGIAPPVIDDELSAMIDERLQIWIRCVHAATDCFLR